MRGMTKSLVLCLALVIALTGIVTGNARWAHDMTDEGTVQMGNLQLGFSAASSNDTQNNIVLGYGQVIVTIPNAYPGYKCTTNVTVHNDGSLPGRIKAINIINITTTDNITVTPVVGLVGVVVDPGQSANGSFLVDVKQNPESDNVSFKMTMNYVQWNAP